MKAILNKNLFQVKNGYIIVGDTLDIITKNEDGTTTYVQNTIATIGFKRDNIPYCELPNAYEIDELALDYAIGEHRKGNEHEVFHNDFNGFYEGYKKAKEKYKYTDEDIDKLLTLLWRNEFKNRESVHLYLQSLINPIIKEIELEEEKVSYEVGDVEPSNIISKTGGDSTVYANVLKVVYGQVKIKNIVYE